MDQTNPDFSKIPALVWRKIISKLDHKSLMVCLRLNSRINNLIMTSNESEFKKVTHCVDITISDNEINKLSAMEWQQMMKNTKFHNLTTKKLLVNSLRNNFLSMITICNDMKMIKIVGDMDRDASATEEIIRIVKNAPKLQLLTVLIEDNNFNDYTEVWKAVDLQEYRSFFEFSIPVIASNELLDAFVSMPMKTDRFIICSLSNETDTSSCPERIYAAIRHFFDATPVIAARPSEFADMEPPVVGLIFDKMPVKMFKDVAQYLRTKLSEGDGLEIGQSENILDMSLTRNGIVRELQLAPIGK